MARYRILLPEQNAIDLIRTKGDHTTCSTSIPSFTERVGEAKAGVLYMVNAPLESLCGRALAGAAMIQRAEFYGPPRARRLDSCKALMIACAGALLLSPSTSLQARLATPLDKIVYHYCPPLFGNNAVAEDLKYYHGVRLATGSRHIYRKPTNIPGSRNYVVEVGGEGYGNREISDFSIMDGRNRRLFLTHIHNEWSMRSSIATDTYFILTEPVPLESIITGRGPGWETTRDDAPADGWTFPYILVKITRGTVRQYRCVFDKSVFVSAEQKKVLAAWAGAIRPDDAMQMVAVWLSEHGARMTADRCWHSG